jgi:ketosteroid isomerase-like protein
MMKPASVFASVVVCVGMCGVVAAIGDETASPLASLIESERAFAKMSVEKSTREAFLAFLADESLLFAPGPVPGKMFYRRQPDRPQKLSWAPDFADVSASGDLGYTSGPWEIRPEKMTDPPTAYGHFNSIWRVQKDGSWKVEVDLGSTHEKPSTAVADVKTVQSPKDNAPAPKETKTSQEWQAELLQVDRDLAKQAGSTDTAAAVKAFESAAADGIRVYRDGHLPAVGKAAAMKLLASSGTGGWQPTLARVSKAGDLGYTSGVIKIDSVAGAKPPTPPAAPAAPKPPSGEGAAAGARPTPPTPPSPPNPSVGGATPPAASAPHYYVRIWRRDKAGVWKIVLDVATA